MNSVPRNFKWLAGCLAATLIATGCTNMQFRNAHQPALASTATTGFAKTHCAEATGGLIRLAKTMPSEANLGTEFVAELTLTAQGCAAQVVVRETVPVGAIYVRSEPVAKVEGNQLIWNLGDLDAGQVVKAKIWFKADQEGTLISCATVSADPRVCAQTFVGKPVIAIEKNGPETAVLGTEITYTILVKNIGTAVARGVMVTDPVPAGMSHSSSGSEVRFDVGELAPGQSKPLTVMLKANQRGKICNTATVSSSNAGSATNTTCTVILVPGLRVETTGTREQILGRNADYEIMVSNTGDTTLHDVTVADVAPPQTTIVAAPGAVIAGNKATWTLASLAPGMRVRQTVKLTSEVTGTHCNVITASSGALNESASACTVWRGIAAVALEVADEPDPIQVGESTTYTIKVINQGFADINNIKVSARFDGEVQPVSSTPGSVNGQVARFPPVGSLKTKQVISYKITVKGVRPGDSRNKITLNADELTTPVEEEESTTVY